MPRGGRGPFGPGDWRGKLPGAPMKGGVLHTGIPEIAERLMRAWRMIGGLPEQLEPVITAEVTIDDLTQDEFWYLRRGTLWQAGLLIGAVAGQQGWATLQAPPAAAGRYLILVDRVIVASDVATVFRFALSPNSPGAGTLRTTGARDERHAGQSSAAFFTTGTDAAPVLPANAIFGAIPASGMAVVSGPWYITANQLLSVVSNNANSNIFISFVWKERTIAPQEL